MDKKHENEILVGQKENWKIRPRACKNKKRDLKSVGPPLRVLPREYIPLCFATFAIAVANNFEAISTTISTLLFQFWIGEKLIFVRAVTAEDADI